MYKPISLILVAVLILVFSFMTVPSALAKEIGEVTTDGGTLNVRAEPKEGSAIIGKLSNGTKVDILGKANSWYKIQFSSKEAFVHQDFIRIHTPAPAPQPKVKPISIYVNDELLTLPFEPVNDNGRLLVPFRLIGEALGIDVSWDNETRQVISQYKEQMVVFTIDQPETIVNGEVKPVTPAPRIVQDRTIIPLRYFAETFLSDVQWDNATRTVTITRDVEEETPIEEESDLPIEVIDEKVGGVAFSGEVKVSFLNVRSGPSVSSTLIDRLYLGDRIQVKGFSGEWIKFEHQGMDAYVHSGYLNLYHNDQQTYILSQPKVSTIEDRTMITWSKIGGEIESGHTFEGNILSIESTARNVERLNEEVASVKAITYRSQQPGVTIDFELADGYSAMVYHSAKEVTIVISNASERGLAGKRIMLDAGHGGKDPGAVQEELFEKDVVFDISVQVQQLLEQLGATVVMTRDTDVFLSLQERVALANESMVDAFVSVHANAAENTAAKGTETFWNATYAGPESKQLATFIQNQLIYELQTTNRGVKEANFAVIRHTQVPSVLVEVGFLSNIEEATRMATPEFRQASARAIVNGLMEFYK